MQLTSTMNVFRAAKLQSVRQPELALPVPKPYCRQPGLSPAQAVPADLWAQLPNIDISALQSAADQLAAAAPAGAPQLAPHWGTTALQQAVTGLMSGLPAAAPSPEAVAKLQETVQQLSSLPSVSPEAALKLQEAMKQLPAVPNISPDAMAKLQQALQQLPPLPDGAAAQQLGSSVSSMLSDQQAAVLSALAQQQQAAAGVLAPLSSSLAPLSSAAQTAVDQAIGAALPAGMEQLQPHWGSLAAQAALENLAALSSTQLPALPPELSADVSSLANSLAAGSAAALSELQAALPGMDAEAAAQATQAATQQLQQVLQLLSNAAAAQAGASTVLPSQLTQLTADLQTLLQAAAPATLTLNLPSDSFNAAATASALTRTAELFWETAQQGHWSNYDMVTLSLSAAGMMLGAGISTLSTPSQRSQPAAADLSEAEVELGYEYDPEHLAEYFRRRPLLVMKRSAVVAAECAAFGVSLLMDLARGGLAANEQARAAQLRVAIERLGPAYVKVAQALSTRVDLLTPAYFMQIQLLQDRVPAFPDEAARASMQRTFGKPIEQVFSAVSDRPVAAASLGQVYRATLVSELGGGDVAVKVQRPGVLAAVALDLYLMRSAAQAVSPQMRSDWVGIIDAWAVRFFHEMDYCREADNARKFAAEMASLQGITVPDTVQQLSSHNVLTTRWVSGEKLCESTAADVRELCNTLLTAYLIQLLETGNLHADPHPGNLLRTPDGRIAILDFGLMTEVTEAQRWALLEYIAHLSTRDWKGVAKDLQALGFIPVEVDPEEAGLVEPLGRIMEQLVGGGGAAKVNIDKVMGDLEKLGEKYPFQVPAFFALILRAFSVIEGIALGVDPDYSIVAECFPYLSRRLLADDSPRARAVLRDILYGGRQRLDVDRLMQLADGFSAYTTDGLTSQAPAAAAAGPRISDLQRMLPGNAAGMTASMNSPSTSASNRPTARSRTVVPVQRPAKPVVDPAVKDALLLIFSKQGSYVQELLVEEAAAAVDALSRRAAGSLLLNMTTTGSASWPTGRRGSAGDAATSVPSFPGIPPFLLPPPFPLPGVPMIPFLPADAAARLQPLVELSEEDKEALNVVRGISTLLSKAMLSAAGMSEDSIAASGQQSALRAGASLVTTIQPFQVRASLAELLPLLQQLAPGLANTWIRFNAALITRAQQRLMQASSIRTSRSTNSPTTITTATTTSTSEFAAGTSAMAFSVEPDSRQAATASTAAQVADFDTQQRPLLNKRQPRPQQQSSSGLDDLLGGGARIKSTVNSRWV